jgi:peptidoglycan-associated lipoprotein
MKQLILLFALFVLGVTNVYSQQKQDPKYVREANLAFNSGKYFEAIPKCEGAFKKLGVKGSLKQKGDMAYKVAESYRNLERYDKANEWYGVCLELRYFDVKPEIYYFKANMQRMLKDFSGASKTYKEYKRLAPESKQKEIDALIAGCETFKGFEDFESKIVAKVETKINTKEFDMAPSFADKKGKKIYFSSSREDAFGKERDPITGQKYMDIFVAEYDDKMNPINVKSIDTKGIINTAENEGSVCFDSKKKTMYFTRCPNKAKAELGCDIWMTDLNGEDFDNITKINLKANDTISVGHPCLTEDGMMLIFVSDMVENILGEKSFGGRDLWYVSYNKKEKLWDSIPKNMGPIFNTGGNELFPSLGPKGQLFFASDGLPGIGGLDIFSAERVGAENKWINPKNIGTPFNSPGNDYAMCDFDGKSGFFTSERKTSSSVEYTPDIWSYNVPPNLYDLRVVVYELGNKNKKIEGAKVVVTETNGQTWEGTTDKTGRTEKWVERKDKSRYITEGNDYQIKSSKARYFTDKNGAKFTTKGLDNSQSFLIEIPLIPIEIRTPEIRYPLDQWTFINDASCKSLDSLKFLENLLKDNPTLVIELYSHTDARDTEIHNQALSENRAKAVYTYLVDQKGVDPRRIKPIGRGEAEPAKWMDEKGVEQVLTETYINQFKATDKVKFEKLHQINRRTTVKVVFQAGSTDIPAEFDPATAPPADPKYKVFINPLPR